ncbi:unnamed protein product, partial [Protopolystoma xenopodis]
MAACRLAIEPLPSCLGSPRESRCVALAGLGSNCDSGMVAETRSPCRRYAEESSSRESEVDAGKCSFYLPITIGNRRRVHLRYRISSLLRPAILLSCLPSPPSAGGANFGQQRRLVNSLWPGLDSASASPGLGLVSGAPACPTRRSDRPTVTSTSTSTATATVSLGGLTGVGRLHLGAIGASDRAESRDPVEWIQTPTTPTATSTATATGARSKSDSGAFSASDEGGVGGGGGAALCRPLRFSIGDLIEEEKCAGSALF